MGLIELLQDPDRRLLHSRNRTGGTSPRCPYRLLGQCMTRPAGAPRQTRAFHP